MALTADRNTKRKDGELITGKMAASEMIYQGALCMFDGGYVKNGAEAASKVVAGVAEAQVDNSAGEDGDLTITLRRKKMFLFANSSTNALDQTHVGGPCYIEDEETVSSNSTDTTEAGTVIEVTSEGVWVHIP